MRRQIERLWAWVIGPAYPWLESIGLMVLIVAIIAIVLLLSGCQHGQVVEPTPPLVTPCIAEPVARIPDEPSRPKSLTDAYVVALIDWANDLLGVVTADRLAWRGERQCIRGLQQQEQIR